MNKKALPVVLLLLAMALTLVACHNLPDADLSVRSPYDKQPLVLRPEEVATYDYTTMFSLKSDSEIYPVLKDYLDTSNLSPIDGGYVLCKYKDQQVRVDVVVKAIDYRLTLTTKYLTVTVGEADTYDYLSLFRASIDGETAAITSDMITNGVKAQAGIYNYTVNFHGVAQTLQVQVEDEVSLRAKYDEIELDDSEIFFYDYAELFELIVNGVETKATDNEIDFSELLTGDGKEGNVYCRKGVETASVSVKLQTNSYELQLAKESITLHTSRAESYDYLSLFTAYKNGKPMTLSEKMVTSNVKPQAGEYEYKVQISGTTYKTLNVIISNAHQSLIVVNYDNYQLPVNRIDTFNFANLFALYVDDVVMRITDSMLDCSVSSDNAQVGQTYVVTLTYNNSVNDVVRQAQFTVTEAETIVIETTDVTTYPNADPIDLTALFTVRDGSELIAVTDDMISGSINYSKEGNNVITIEYKGLTEQAVVTVKRGVIINTVSDVVTIACGTDKSKYNFAADFELLVNGLRFNPSTYLYDVDLVNFAVAGEYPVSLIVDYGSAANNTEQYKSVITYKVQSASYTVDVKQPIAQTVLGSSFRVQSNLVVTINGINQKVFTTDKADVTDSVTCYIQIIDDVDVKQVGKQQVAVDVYVNGVNGEPVRVTYYVNVVSNATVTASDAVIFVGGTLYTTDLFKIYRGGDEVPVTYDMLSGHVDAFAVGIYKVQIDFEGITRYAQVTVLDDSIVGSYFTPIKSIYVAADYDDDGDPVQDEEPETQYGPLIINFDGTVTIDNHPAQIVSAVDEHTVYIAVSSQTYILHIYDGIVVVEPDNSLKVSFSNNKRPLVYFSEDMYNLPRRNNRIVINYGSEHVIGSTTTSYSVDIARVTSKATSEQLYYAVKVQLVHKNSADTVYDVSWGYATFNDDFAVDYGAEGTLTLNGERYVFKMSDPEHAKIDRNAASNPHAGFTFRQYATNPAVGYNPMLRFDSLGGVTYTDAQGKAYALTVSDVTNLKYGGYNSADDTFLMYKLDVGTNNSEWFCFKFQINSSQGTFSVVSKQDNLYGLYLYDNKYIFLDGYGTGQISYNTSSYAATPLSYRVVNNELKLTFITKYDDGNGFGATLYVDETLNVLAGKDFDNSSLVGARFVNKHIVDGAIVTVDTEALCNSTNLTADDIYSAITIVTASGEMSLQDKVSSINIAAVNFEQNGIYLVRVSVVVGGANYNLIYAAQVYLV